MDYQIPIVHYSGIMNVGVHLHFDICVTCEYIIRGSDIMRFNGIALLSGILGKEQGIFVLYFFSYSRFGNLFLRDEGSFIL